jgi:hypothetical protein
MQDKQCEIPVVKNGDVFAFAALPLNYFKEVEVIDD